VTNLARWLHYVLFLSQIGKYRSCGETRFLCLHLRKKTKHSIFNIQAADSPETSVFIALHFITWQGSTLFINTAVNLWNLTNVLYDRTAVMCCSSRPVQPLHHHHHHHNHHHHHISFMELSHLLIRSSLTYPEVSSKVYHDSFCQLGSSISLSWVIYFEGFYLHVITAT